MRGIVLIALGSPDYIRMAYNLTVSIKASEDVSISLVTTDNLRNYLTPKQASIFENIIDCPVEYYHLDNSVSYVKAKVHLYDISPYDQTLFIDSDTAWNASKKPSELFDSLNGMSITFKNTGYYSISENKSYDNPKYTYWYDVNEMVTAYKIKTDVYQIQSEFIYFEKNKTSKKFFNDAIKIYTNQKVSSKIPFAGRLISDEMAFSISLALNNLKPHIVNWFPTYWHFLSTEKIIENPSIFVNNYYVFSIGGTNAPGYVISFYRNIIQKAFNKIGGIPFTITTKLQQS